MTFFYDKIKLFQMEVSVFGFWITSRGTDDATYFVFKKQGAINFYSHKKPYSAEFSRVGSFCAYFRLRGTYEKRTGQSSITIIAKTKKIYPWTYF